MLTDAELEYFSRQLLVIGFDLEQQETLREASVLVVGCGGLGSPLAIYLAAAGVGELVLIDHDEVEVSNLHRQPLHGSSNVGGSKVASAESFVRDRYPLCRVTTHQTKVDAFNAAGFVANATLVADASDNYPVRYALNDACLVQGVPLVSAAAVRGEGQLATFHAETGGPCYQCLYPDTSSDAALSCRENGVLGPVVGVLGTMQALEVIKVITGWGENLQGQLLLADLANNGFNTLAISRRDDCPACGFGKSG